MVLLLVLIVAGGLLLIDANDFRPQIQATLGQALGREVTLGKLHVSVWSGSLDADQIRIGDDPAFGPQAFISASSLRLGVRLWPLLLHRQMHITSLTLQQPTCGCCRTAPVAGISPASAPARRRQLHRARHAFFDPPPAFSVDKLRITDGRIDLQRAVGDARSYRKVALSADHVGLGAAFPFSMGAISPVVAACSWMASSVHGVGQRRADPGRRASAGARPGPGRCRLDAQHDGVGGVLDIDTQISSAHGVLSRRAASMRAGSSW